MRKPMITRSITSTEVLVLGMDLINRTPVEITVVLPRTYKDDKAIMKALCKKCDTSEFKVSAILDVKVSKGYVGMTEEEFIEKGHPLDENRKFIVDEIVEEQEVTE